MLSCSCAPYCKASAVKSQPELTQYCRTLFFLFYFNRLFATVISYALRAYTWHTFRAYIDITSLQISLLGGRIFFKSIRYHGHNETVLVHDGHITWRYWLRKVRQAEIFEDEAASHAAHVLDSPDELDEKSIPEGDKLDRAELGKRKPQSDLPCRIQVKVSGVEAFLYNHGPAYDLLVAGVQNANRGDADSSQSPVLEDVSTLDQQETKESGKGPPLDIEKTQSSAGFSPITNSPSRGDSAKQVPAYLRALPIYIECKKAAAAVGNENTTSIVVAKVEAAQGRVDARAAGPLDLFKLLFKFDFTNVQVHMKPNQDFKATQLQSAQRLARMDGDDDKPKHRGLLRFHTFRQILDAWKRIPRMMPYRAGRPRSVRTASIHTATDTMDGRPSSVPGYSEWHGLARFLDDDEAIQEEWDDVEYARYSSIADCKHISMNFYWDIPGTVFSNSADQTLPMSAPCDPNGSSPPDYGLDLTVSDGLINYGPWADRQRVVLQQVFFPAVFVDAKPMAPLSKGQTRVPTVFKMHLCLDGNVTLRIPTREPSKDWRWQGRSVSKAQADSKEDTPKKRRGRHRKDRKRKKGASGVDPRPFGWLDVTVKADSVINYTMDMYARSDGFHNKLDVDVMGTEISSSVNHGLLWKASKLNIDGDLSNPLQWNALRTWIFKIVCHDLDLYILRDHMFLLTDLISDWSAGPPPDFFTFVPFQYQLDLAFADFKLFLNSNDANLINDPIDPDDNNFFILGGKKLHAELGIAIDRYRPATSGVTFDVSANDLFLELQNPPRVTLHTLLRSKRVASLPRLTLTGSHTAFQQQSPELTDILQMDICGTGLSLQAFGYVIRHFVNVKENYFGDFLHFKTFEEFQSGNADPSSALAEEIEKYRFRRSNDLDVILCITVEQPTILLPANIYSAENYIKAELPLATVDLRVTNYYLDLETNISPVSITFSDRTGGAGKITNSSEQIHIERVDLCGHRLFGLPPTEPAYVSNWDIDVGSISGECSAAFLQRLVNSGRALAFGLDDLENAVPMAQAMPILDVTFVRVTTNTVSLWLDVGDGAIGVSLDPVNVDFNDRANSLFSSRLTARIPNVKVTCIDTGQNHHHLSRTVPSPAAKCLAFIQTSIDVAVMQRKKDFSSARDGQQEHLSRQDVRTNRASFLVDRQRTKSLDSQVDAAAIIAPAMPAPRLAPPLKGFQNKRVQPKARNSTGQNVPTYPGSRVYPQQANVRRPSDRRLSTTFNLTSAYTKPDFPMSGLEVDLSEVPAFGASSDDDNSDAEDSSPGSDVPAIAADEDTVHITCLVTLSPGLRILLKPQVTKIGLAVASALLPNDSEDVLDAFQMDVMGSVVRALQQKRGQGRTLDMSLDIPSINVRILNEPDVASNTKDLRVKDQIDLEIGYCTTAIRSKFASEPSQGSSVLMIYSTLESLSAELSGHAARQHNQRSAIRVNFEDILIWSNIAQTRAVHVSFKELMTLVSARQVEVVVSNLLRWLSTAEAVASEATSLDVGTKTRPRYMAHFLSTRQGGAPDPPYLSRMTHILRAFPDHYRNQDSWKMISRLRHAYGVLQEDDRVELASNLLDHAMLLADTNETAAEWMQWCTWDIPQPEITQASIALFAETATQSPQTIPDPLQLTLQSGAVRVLLESDGKSSEVSVAKLALDVSIQPPVTPSGLMLTEQNLRTLTVVQITTAAVLIHLGWDLLDIIDPLAQALDDNADLLNNRHVEASDYKESLDVSANRRDFQIVLSNGTGSVMLDTMNLHHVSSSEQFKLSLIATSRAPKTYGMAVCMLMNADSATSELRGSVGRIWRTTLTAPSINVDYRQRLDGNSAELRVGGIYGDLKIALEQDILGLMATVKSILAEEVVHAKRLERTIQSLSHNLAQRDDSHEHAKSELNINAALLAGNFNFEIALLKTLTLSISGKTANMHVAPAKGPGTSLHIEADIGPVQYKALSNASGSPAQQAFFQTPPVNISTGLQIQDQRIGLQLSTVIHEIKVEAAALQNVLAILARPEVHGVLEEARHSAADIQQQANIALGKTISAPISTPKPVKDARTFVYNVNATLQGLRVVATAPVSDGNGSRAEFDLGLGLTQAVIKSNEGTDFPDVIAHVSNIFATVDLLHNARRTSGGRVGIGLSIRCFIPVDRSKGVLREVAINSESFDVEVTAITASTIVDIVTHVQKKIVDLDLSKEVEHLRRFRGLRHERAPKTVSDEPADELPDAPSASPLVATNLLIQLDRIRFVWLVDQTPNSASHEPHDLEFTLARVQLSVKQQHRARLVIKDMQLQMVPESQPSFKRTPNSALLPEAIFTVLAMSSDDGLGLAFHAVGQALDLRLDSGFVVPLGSLIQSGSSAIDKYRHASSNWKTSSVAAANSARTSPFGKKSISSLLVDASFAGAVVYLEGHISSQGKENAYKRHASVVGARSTSDSSTVTTTMRAPGIALKLEYTGNAQQTKEPSLKAEMRIEASSNIIYPELVPIALQISDSVKDIMREQEARHTPPKEVEVKPQTSQPPSSRLLGNDTLLSENPLLTKTTLSLGLRICSQEFGLSCQPIARVNAKVQIEDIYITLNTMDPLENDRFIAVSAAMTKFGATVQHVYSRESTFSFDVESIVLSVMNSRHLDGGTSGLSAILKINPMKTAINARQLQDVLLFREIWMPRELGRELSAPTAPSSSTPAQADEFLVQRYRQVASAAAFPWNATVAMEEIFVDLDLGQSIGKTSFSIKNLWAASRKSSGWQQDLYLGIDQVFARCTGRMGGYIELSELKVHTSIEWPSQELQAQHAPLIQATLGFARLRVKAAFDYQPFAFADVEEFGFLMYNVREDDSTFADRLVAMLDGGKVFAYLTATSPAQAVGLYQAFDRLIQEKQGAYKQSVNDLEKHLQRPSVTQPYNLQGLSPLSSRQKKESGKFPISLRTNVVVMLRSLSVGAFPSTFLDSQILKLEAMEVQTRFAVNLTGSRIHSDLSMTLGQLQVALAAVQRGKILKTLGDISVEEVITSAVSSKGGVILRVPRVVASMQTWQAPEEKQIDFIFKSLFEGKVDVGWNYSRISFIRGMWNAHSRSLAGRLGKALPESAVRITTEHHENDGKEGESGQTSNEQGRITAVVSMPLFKYEYNALEPPIIETPQLRDMGEATPPLEWIGLHRERLPNVIHQVVIVSLLQVAKEVEDAYGHILGAS